MLINTYTINRDIKINWLPFVFNTILIQWNNDKSNPNVLKLFELIWYNDYLIKFLSKYERYGFFRESMAYTCTTNL